MKRLGLSLAVLLLSCTPARTVVIDGQKVPYEDAARDEFRKGKSLLDAGKNAEAAQAFAAFLDQYQESALYDEALFRRGQALSRAGKLQDAQAAFQDLLEKRPTSPYKRPAAVELGLVQAKLGKPAPSGKIGPALEEMNDKEKEAAASSLAETYARQGQPGEALRWSARAADAAPDGAERDARVKDLEAALEAAPASDVAKIVAELDHKSASWPHAALKLARIQQHVGDRAHALELANEVASSASGDAADQARSIQHAIQQAGQVKPALLGIILPLTGDLKGFADQALNAIALVLDLQNRGALQISVKDTKGDPQAAADAVEELAKEGAIAVLGPLGVDEGLAAATRAQQLGLPILSLSRAEGLTALGDFVFRDMPPSSAQAKAVAEYAQKKLNAKTFGILQPDSSYGEEMGRYFWDALDQTDGEVRAFEHYPRSTTTFKPFISHMVGRSQADLSERKEFSDEAEKIAKEITDPYRRRKALAQLKSQQAPVVDFDALFIPDGARTVRLIAPAIAAEDVITAGCDVKELEVVRKTTKNDQLRTVQLLGTSLWDSTDLVDERSGVGRYVQCSIFVDSFFAQSDRPATKKFVDEYSNTYHRVPGFLEAHAYDAAGLMKKAWETKHPQTREDLRDALAGFNKPFEGAAGDTVIGKDREAQKPFFWLWINRGSIVEFDPEGPPPVPPTAPPSGAAPAEAPAKAPPQPAKAPPPPAKQPSKAAKPH